MKRIEAQSTSTFVPEGAPQRMLWPYFAEMFFVPLMGVWAVTYLVDETLGRPVAVFTAVTLFGALCWYIIFLISDYDRTGWYEYKPPVIPPSPFVISKWSGFAFEEAGIRCGRKEWGPYEAVETITINCKDVYFSSIKINLSDGSDSIYVGANSGVGAPARTALAILKQKAPHARFEGPSWIVEGWAPRLGFRNPNTRGGG